MQTKGRTWRKRQIKSVKTASLAHKQEYIALFQWAKQNGVFFHKMKPAIFPGTGRGLMATKQINAGDLLISVPSKLLVTEEVLRNSYFDGINSTKALEFSTIELLCLFLILERSLGKQSFWSAYISMLPLDYNMPAYFKHHELKHTPDFFAEHGWSQVKSIRKCYSSLKKFLLDFNDKTKSIQLTFDDVCWAWNAVNTRCVYMIGKARFKHSPQKDNMSCSLAPLLDLLNHSCNVQVKFLYDNNSVLYSAVPAMCKSVWLPRNNIDKSIKNRYTKCTCVRWHEVKIFISLGYGWVFWNREMLSDSYQNKIQERWPGIYQLWPSQQQKTSYWVWFYSAL